MGGTVRLKSTSSTSCYTLLLGSFFFLLQYLGKRIRAGEPRVSGPPPEFPRRWSLVGASAPANHPRLRLEAAWSSPWKAPFTSRCDRSRWCSRAVAPWSMFIHVCQVMGKLWTCDELLLAIPVATDHLKWVWSSTLRFVLCGKGYVYWV